MVLTLFKGIYSGISVASTDLLDCEKRQFQTVAVIHSFMKMFSCLAKKNEELDWNKLEN